VSPFDQNPVLKVSGYKDSTVRNFRAGMRGAARQRGGQVVHDGRRGGGGIFEVLAGTAFFK
jgi:hypothetical protein